MGVSSSVFIYGHHHLEKVVHQRGKQKLRDFCDIYFINFLNFFGLILILLGVKSHAPPEIDAEEMQI